MMYNGKPVVIYRPWWRHPIFPWGWYSLRKDIALTRDEIYLDGCDAPGDGGGGRYRHIINETDDNNGTVISPEKMPGSWCLQFEESEDE